LRKTLCTTFLFKERNHLNDSRCVEVGSHARRLRSSSLGEYGHIWPCFVLEIPENVLAVNRTQNTLASL
jgi:hypothetical protein